MTKQLLPRFLVVIFAVLWSAHLGAQTNQVVTGKVLNANSEPLSGVAIVEKGRSGGTTTNLQGEFSFRVSSLDATLVFSFIGMESQEERLNGRTRVEITLLEDKVALDEVVVIGYGTVRRSDLTGSVATVAKSAFSDKQLTNMEDALRGQIAGVRVLSDNGEPGEQLNIRIRGSGSLNASNAPIYVIDGIVSEATDISPGDIESMEILKDASATAIYGAKGSNGVVMITTKRGEKGATRVSLSANYSIQDPVRLLDLMETPEFARTMSWNAYSFYPKDAPGINFGQAARVFYQDSEGNYYVYNTMEKWSSPDYYDPSSSNYVNSDWQRAMMRQVRVQEYNISVRGGDDKGRFAVLGGYYNQPGILVNSDFERYSFRTNYERTLGPKGGVFGLNLNGTYSKKSGLSTDAGGPTLNMLVQNPTKRLSAEDWDAEGSENVLENNNPLYQAKRIKRQTERTNSSLRLYFNLPIAKSLKLNIAGNFMNNNLHEENYFPRDVAQGRTEGGKAENTMTRTFNWNSENLLYYTPKMNNTCHRFDAMAGVILEQTMRKTLFTEAHGFELEDLNSAAMQDGITPWSISTSYIRDRMLSYLGRANYSYKHYNLTGTIRFDGSSRFGSYNRWGIFPSGAFMWRITDEPFMKEVKAINDLRVRLSAGATGNSSIPAQQSLGTMTSLHYPTNGTITNYGIITDRPSNPYLKWESLIQYDAALEFGLFKNRLTGTLEVYYKKTTDLLFEQPAPYSSGYATQWSNIASVGNKGLEVTIGGTPVRMNHIAWSLNYNMAFNHSEVLSLGGASEMVLNPASATRCTNYGILRVGQALGNWYGYQSNGVWRYQSQIDLLGDNYSSAGISKSNLRPGSTRLVDQNNDGTVDDLDRIILGNSQPKFTGGLQSILRLYNFTLTVGLEYCYGGTIFNATARELTQLNSNSGRNSLASASNYWTPTLYDKTTGEIVHQGNELSDLKMPITGWENFVTDRFIEDASYLRIDNISLNYALPSALAKKFRLNKLSIFASVRNAWVFTNYTGYDPDVSVGKGIYADLLPKLDAAAFPRYRTYTLGINIEF